MLHSAATNTDVEYPERPATSRAFAFQRRLNRPAAGRNCDGANQIRNFGNG